MDRQLGFVDGFGVVEVIGSAPDGSLVVQLKGRCEQQRIVSAAQLQPVDCEAAKKARLQQFRSIQFRQGMNADMKRRTGEAHRR